jgi:hypothetical protein
MIAEIFRQTRSLTAWDSALFFTGQHQNGLLNEKRPAQCRALILLRGLFSSHHLS